MNVARLLAESIAASGARRIAFVGAAKNAGKTTALLAALRELRALGLAPGAVSSGRDGEAVDAITGEPKPRYAIARGQLLASARAAFEAASFPSELLETLPFGGRFGAVEVRRAAGDGEAEMIGPATASELSATAEALERHGASPVLLDGALSRRAFASVRVADAIVLAVGLSAGENLPAALAEARRLVGLVTLGGAPEGAEARRVSGAVTEERLAELRPAPGEVLVVDDFASVFLGAPSLAGLRLSVARPARLLAITANPTAPARPPADPRAFLDRVAGLAPAGVLVVDLVAGEARTR